MSSPIGYTLTESERSRVADVQRLGASGPPSVPELAGMLSDPSWVVRRAVVDALGAAGDAAVGSLCDVLRGLRDDEASLAAAVDALVASTANVEPAVLRLTSDPNPAVVADAAQVLGRRRSHVAVPVLIRLAEHRDDNVAVAAIEALGRVGGRAAVEALVDAVGTGSFFRTFPAIDVLGRSGDPRVVEPLARLLGNPSYLPEAARALGRSGERAAVKPLVELLRSSSDAVVRVAALALWELRDRFEERSGGDALVIDELVRAQVGAEAVRRLIRVLSGADVAEAVAICKLLGAIGSAEAAPALAAKLDAAPSVAACAAESLKRIGKDADAHLLQAIRQGQSAQRKVLLPIAHRASAAEHVAACLADPDPEVRALACDTLARLGNTSVVPALFNLLSDANLRVVHSATSAIQALGSRHARQLAIAAAESESPVVRRAAVRVLAYFGERAALRPVLDRLADPDARVREAAIQSLPYLEDPRALEALFAASKAPEASTRAIAMRALGRVPKADERVVSLLLRGLSEPEPWVRYYACQSLGRLAYAPAADAVARLLDDEAGQVRVAAVEALSHLDSAEARETLRRAAAFADIHVRRAALVGIGIAHRAEDLPVVLAAAGAPDTPTRLMALSALASFPSPLVLGALSSAASDSDEQVRAAAIDFLAARPEQEATEVLVELLDAEATHDRARAALLVPSDGRTAGLLVALESASDELAPMLTAILARLDRPEARAALLAAMKLDNVAARKAAATALAARQDPEMTAALEDAMTHDPNQEVRQICTLLLRG